MTFLADENFPGRAVRALRAEGFDVGWVVEEGAGSVDEDVLARCAAHKRTLLTLDKDFGELVFGKGLPAECGVILFRVDAESPERFAEITLAALRSRRDWGGYFTVIGSNRIRMRPLKPAL